MNLLIDTKNISIFGAGISAYFTPILENWIGMRPELNFYLTGPKYDFTNLKHLPNCHIVDTVFPFNLPKSIRHPVYDNFIFPSKISELKPDFIFSPYHDVRLPSKTPSVMMIHDTCLKDLNGVYPLKVRAYYEHMLKLNLKKCSEIVTVSESSKLAIIDRYNYPANKINVVYNTLDSEFFTSQDKKQKVKGAFDILYTGGNEYRKNINRLLDVIELVLVKQPNAKLLVTGAHQHAWEKNLFNRSDLLKSAVHFLGRLSIAELKNAYANADVVVYPSLCEGFGRACLEAMAIGTAIACSDLPVLREVADGYATFFDPYSPQDIADKIQLAKSNNKKSARIDNRFTQENVFNSFINHMDRIIETYCNAK